MTVTSIPNVAPGSDCRDAFQAAYQNRYTWEPGFGGYKGRCIWEQGDRRVEGRFQIGADLKAKVEGIDDAEVEKAIASQLWEVAIHRVRRSFEQVHGANTFTAGDCTDEGLEVLIGGKGEGDRYRIKGDVVTMVHRHIHGTVVTIHTGSTTDTGSGYLSRSYTSQYSDPASGEVRGASSSFEDTFVPLGEQGSWVLERRAISSKDSDGKDMLQVFEFNDLAAL
ncbi:conserved hypothetical protein (DUF3386) [Synechococcus sp. BIOS-E4-1]|uniref:DUF3386 domain-containing protein n=1 Tax=Synechococcus sp. BIOS-E4-1 TaxID=1400864 RepID=UPI0016441672|nr:DUF3386 domain-containing protein [Synechococcus sp. BIOS-E4-1]QNI55099.1 conserved hypothetical protein (DUF3386) [Synechococcus sp. BIOS-E4-1]